MTYDLRIEGIERLMSYIQYYLAFIGLFLAEHL